MNSRSLNCFYDLSIAPCSYDFFAFLISAELHRIRNNFDSLRLIFLPGPEEVYRIDDLRTFDQNDNFFKNVLLQGPLLYKSCKSILWLDNRSDASDYLQNFDAIFPRGYSLKNARRDYLFHGIVSSYLRGEPPVFFEAPNYSKGLAQDFLSKFPNERKIITLTTRELKRDDPGCRVVDVDFWRDFFRQLDQSKFQPLIIRDTSAAFNEQPLFENIPEVSAASIHLHFRYAIYQAAFLNIFKPNGPSILSVYGTPATLFFFQASDLHPSISLDWYKIHHGMNFGSQYPLSSQNKKIVWGGENTKSITDTIKFLESDNSCDNTKLHPVTDRNTLFYSTKIALLHTLENMQHGVLDEDVILLQVYKDFLKKGLITGPDPIVILKDREKSNFLKKGTSDKVLAMDKATKGVLAKQSLIYQAG